MTVGSGIRLLLAVLRLTLRLLVLVAELSFWAGYVLRSIIAWGSDAVRGLGAIAAPAIRCPRGHDIRLDDVNVFRCDGCGYTYEAAGGALRCVNPECVSPTASFVDCPVCGLSTRSPWRWGRP